MPNPARFQRITKRTKVTAPCVLARIVESVANDFWVSKVFYDQADVSEKRGDYTYWLPIEFPEVRR